MLPTLSCQITFLCQNHLGSCISGVRKRVVSKRVVLADAPLYQNVLQKVFPCSATLAEESYDFDIPGTPKPERGRIRQTALLQNRHSVSPQM